MASPFRSASEFRDVMDRIFTMIDESTGRRGVTKPVFERYRALVAERYPHLEV